MAKFKFEKIQLGYEGKEITTVMALERIEFESGDTVVEIPSEHDGMPVTHILFRQSINPAHVRFHDWHHPAQGDGEGSLGPVGEEGLIDGQGPCVFQNLGSEHRRLLS